MKAISLLFILLIGAYLRLNQIADYMTFLGDEGRDVLIVKRMIVDHDFVLLGPTASVGGFFLGPMYYYFMTPFLWLWQLDPVGPAIMVALFGIATILLVYFVGKEFFSPAVGLISASIYALSPLVIAYSRSSWNPNLVPFFSLLLIYLLWRFATKREYKMIFFIGFTAGLGIQFHYLYSFLMVFVAFFLLLDVFVLSDKKMHFKEKTKSLGKILLIGFGGFLVTFSPFILFELRHGFQNSQALFKFFLAGNETGFNPMQYIETIKDVIFRSYGRLLFRMPNYELWNGFPAWNITALTLVIRMSILLTLSVLAAMSLLELKYFKNLYGKYFNLNRQQWMGALILFLWFICSMILFGFYKRNIYDYYFGIFYAFPFLALGVVFWQVGRSKLGSGLMLLLLTGLLYYNWQGRPFVYPPNKQLEQTKLVAKTTLDLTYGQPYNFALLTATNSDHAYRYFFEIWGRKPVTIEQPSIDPERKTVTDQLIVMCENPVCQPLGHSLWEIAGFGRAEIVEEKAIFPVKLFRLVHYKGTE